MCKIGKWRNYEKNALKGGDTLTMPKTIEKGISDLVGVFTAPIIVFSGGWGDTLPEWLKSATTLERLEVNMRALRGEEMTGRKRKRQLGKRQSSRHYLHSSNILGVMYGGSGIRIPPPPFLPSE